MNRDKTIVFDGHNDVLLNLHNPQPGQAFDFFERNSTGHIDLPRAREGGFGGGFFAIMTLPTAENDQDIAVCPPPPNLPPPVELSHAQQTAMAMMALLFRLEAESQGQLKVARTVTEIERCLENGIMAALVHFEGAEPIDPDLNALEVFYQAGLRSLGVVWSRPTIFGQGVPFKFPHSPDIGDGLTDTGRALVKACNQLGIMIDLSHLNEAGFWDVAKLSDAPLVATHSNVYALCPSPRNLTDKQLAAIKETGGMVGLNFGVGFLREDGQWDSDTPIKTMVRHIDYLVEHVGINCVGLGSDFDGAFISHDIGDVSGLPKFIEALRARGYTDEALQKITHQNWLRVLKETLKP